MKIICCVKNEYRDFERTLIKFFHVISLVIAFTFSIALISCNAKQETFDKEIETRLVEKVIHSAIGWAKNKDLALLHSVIVNDTNYIKVDPDDRVVR